jgi:hypothetical protein
MVERRNKGISTESGSHRAISRGFILKRYDGFIVVLPSDSLFL